MGESLAVEGRSVTKIFLLCLAVLTALYVQPVQGACVTLTWTAPGDDGYSGIATKYDIRYLSIPISEANWDYAYSVGWLPSPGVAGSRQACLVTGLVSGTTYYFALRTADEKDNWSEISNIAYATAPDDRCQGSIGNIDCDSAGTVDIADVSVLIDNLFISLRPLCCPGEANVDQDPFGNIDISDIAALVYYLFTGVTDPPPCPSD
jgi:hypothetical protein